MSLNTDYRSAVELTGAARAAVTAISSALPLEKYLPTRANETLNYAFDVNQKSKIDLAEFRAFDTEAPYGRSFGSITKEGKLPPISRKLPVSEYTELLLNGRTESIGAVLDRYAERLGTGIAFRLELARAEVLRTGTLVLAENGVSASIDYGRDASLTVTPTIAWDQVSATPVDDIIAWRQTVTNLTAAPSVALLTLDVVEALSKNAQVIAFALGRTDSLPGRVTYTAVEGVLSSFGLSTQIIDNAYSGFDLGVAPFPAGTFLLLPGAGSTIAGASLGSTDFGVPAESLQPSYGIPDAEQAGIFAGSFSREDPQGLDVLASAIALPILQRANATLSAAVFTSGS